MHLRESLVRNMVFPLIDVITRSSTLESLHQCEKSQWWSLKKLKELQEKKLRKLISYAYGNVPYYRKIFKTMKIKPEETKNVEHPEKISILTHEDVRQHLHDLVL